jgi:serine/threonine-protein kinase
VSLSAETELAARELTASPTIDAATETELPLSEAPVERTVLLAHAGVPAHVSAGGGRRRSVIVGVSAFALVAIATLAVAAPRVLRRYSAPSGASAPLTSAPLAGGTASSDAPAQQDSPAPSAMASTTSSPALTAPVAPPPARRAGSPPVKDRAAKPDCSPPYYRDASGIRRVKRECL